jgi:DNA (cytosine-5)-methyltransferase 1
MNRPRLLDLFCGAGGAAMGYHRAGFEVTGVDINPQKNYPFHFNQGDALEFLKEYGVYFDAVHASPPCQRYSGMSVCRPGLADDYPDLVDATRAMLTYIGRPWVMENVAGSPLITQPTLDGKQFGVTLCGHMFGLKLYRHRLFESNIPLTEPNHPRHLIPGGKAGHWKPGEIISVSGNCSPIELAREAMGIDWMNRNELAESIPPAYTEYVGKYLAAEVAR